MNLRQGIIVEPDTKQREKTGDHIIGDVFEIQRVYPPAIVGFFMLCKINNNKYTLINILSGTRWSDNEPVLTDNKHSKKDIDSIVNNIHYRASYVGRMNDGSLLRKLDVVKTFPGLIT